MFTYTAKTSNIILKILLNSLLGLYFWNYNLVEKLYDIEIFRAKISIKYWLISRTRVWVKRTIYISVFNFFKKWNCSTLFNAYFFVWKDLILLGEYQEAVYFRRISNEIPIGDIYALISRKNLDNISFWFFSDSEKLRIIPLVVHQSFFSVSVLKAKFSLKLFCVIKGSDKIHDKD